MARITLRLPEGIHAQLVTEARRRGKSVNQVIVDRIEAGLPLEPGELNEGERIRLALGDLVADPKVLLRGLPKPDVPLLSHAELQRRMPQLSPPLSEIVMAEREDRI